MRICLGVFFDKIKVMRHTLPTGEIRYLSE